MTSQFVQSFCDFKSNTICLTSQFVQSLFDFKVILCVSGGRHPKVCQVDPDLAGRVLHHGHRVAALDDGAVDGNPQRT